MEGGDHPAFCRTAEVFSRTSSGLDYSAHVSLTRATCGWIIKLMLLEHALPVDDNDDVCQSAAVAKQYTIVMRSVKENTGVCIEHNVGQIFRYQSAQRAFTITCRTVAAVVFLLLPACPRRSFADVLGTSLVARTRL